MPSQVAWKLSFVLRGDASSTLLETYHRERQPVAAVTAAHAAVDGLRMLSPVGREATRDSVLEEVPCIMAAYRYGATPVVPQRWSDAAVSGEVGARQPHLWLDPEQTRADALDVRLVRSHARGDLARRPLARRRDRRRQRPPLSLRPGQRHRLLGLPSDGPVMRGASTQIL